MATCTQLRTQLYLFFFFRQGFTGVPEIAGGIENKEQFPLLAGSLKVKEGSLFLIWGEDRIVSRGGARGLTGWFAHPTGGVEPWFFQ